MTRFIPGQHGGLDQLTELVADLAQCAERLGDPLDLEIAVSSVVVPDEDVVVATRSGSWIFDADAVAGKLEKLGDARGATLLNAFALLGTGAVARAAREAADRLAVAGISAAGPLASLGGARPTNAWVFEPDDEIAAVIVDFDNPGGRPHAFAAFFDWDRPGLIRQINLMNPMDGRPELWPGLEPITLPIARMLIEDPLRQSNPFCGRHGLREYRPIVLSRLVQFDSRAHAEPPALTVGPCGTSSVRFEASPSS